MRVFVTGASGFIGRRLVPELCRAGHEVTALLLADEPAASALGAAVRRGDMTDPRTLTGVLDGQHSVVHLAGAVGYGQSFERCRRLNRDGTANVAGEALRAGVRRFLHMSSVSVYGRRPGVRLDEESALCKIGDPYGDTKIEAERILRTLETEGHLELTIVRPTVIYGPGDERFLPRLVENLRSGRSRVIGSGRNTVDAIHVDDVVRFLAAVLVDARSIGGIYNLNHPANPPWNELVAAVAAAIGVAAPRRQLPYPLAMALAAGLETVARLSGKPPRLTRYGVRVVGRQYHYVTERARRDLGFQPRVNLLDGIRACLEEAGCA